MLTERDYERSCTSHSLALVIGVLREHCTRPLESMLDIGCGYGGVPASIAQALSIPRVVGIDSDARVVDEAQSKGVEVIVQDVSSERLPFADGEFSLVTSFGVLDCFPSFDFLLREINRVVRPGGVAAISLPNLASWHNRLTLLSGHQPRDVEVSEDFVVGVGRWYAGGDPAPVGHIHTVTARAFSELMARHGFDQLALHGLTPQYDRSRGRFLYWIDAQMARSSNLARRFLYVGARSREPAVPRRRGG